MAKRASREAVSEEETLGHVQRDIIMLKTFSFPGTVLVGLLTLVCTSCLQKKVAPPYNPVHHPAIEYHTVHATGAFGQPYRVILKRYSRPEGKPVVLLHGLGKTGRAFDLVEGSPELSLATFLFGQGYDVWLLNLRNRELAPGLRSTCPPPHEIEQQADPSVRKYRCETASIDDYAIYDVPPMLNYLAALTGQPMTLVGNSLGGLVFTAYLEGAFHDRAMLAQGLKRVRLSTELAAQRGGAIEHLVYLFSSPIIRFRWTLEQESERWQQLPPGERQPWVSHLYKRMVPDAQLNPDYARYNFFLSLLAGSASLDAQLLRHELVSLGTILSNVLQPDTYLHPLIVARPAGYGWINWPPNLPEWGPYLLLDQVVDFPGRVLRQLLDIVRTGSFASFDRTIDYGSRLSMLRNLKITFVHGGRDKVFMPGTGYQTIVEQMGSGNDVHWKVFPELGHDDFLVLPSRYPELAEVLAD